MEILAVVLEAIADAPHVQVIVMLDIELDTIPEVDAPGVSVYRNELMQFLKGKRLFGICERFIRDGAGLPSMFHCHVNEKNCSKILKYSRPRRV